MDARNSSPSRALGLNPLAFIAGGLVACGILASMFILATAKHNPIPLSARRGLIFPLYYPDSKQLPRGYDVDATSFQQKDGVLIFNIKTPVKTVAVSQQPIPADVANRQIGGAPIRLPGERDYQAPAGHAHIGFWGVNYVADVVADGTWIIINVKGLTPDQAGIVVQSLKKI